VPTRRTRALATTGALVLFAVALAILPAAPAAAQDVVQDEGSAYRAWHEASQAADSAKAIAAGRDYLAKYPTGQYADFMKKWLGTAQMGALDAAIKAKQTAQMLAVGKDILAGDPENLNVVYAMASQLRREMLSNPPVYDNAAAGVELAKKGVAMIEAGKTLAGVQSFDKNATLAWMSQILALNEQKNGSAEQAIKLFEKSTSYAPLDPQVAGVNLLRSLALHQAAYGEAAKAYMALPDADRVAVESAAADAKPEAKAAREKLNAAAEGVIGVATSFVALSKVKNFGVPMREKVNATLETVYKTRHPQEKDLTGLQKLLQEKESALGAAAPTPGA
jgi:hypothetical protein